MTEKERAKNLLLGKTCDNCICRFDYQIYDIKLASYGIECGENKDNTCKKWRKI